MLIRAPNNMTVRNLMLLLKYDDIEIIIDRRNQRIFLEGHSTYGNEKLTSLLERFNVDSEGRYNNGG